MNYSRYLSISSAMPLALALAACGGGAGGPGGPGGGGGAGTPTFNLTPLMALASYAPVEAEGNGNGPQTVEAAQETTGGIEGYGAATEGVGRSAVSTTGTYVVGRVDRSVEDKLTIKVGEQEYTLDKGDTGTTDAGYDWTAYGNTGHSASDKDEGAYVLNSENVSLAAFTKGGAWEVVPDPHNEEDEWTIPSMEGYGLIVTGLQTPVANLPEQGTKQTADYDGEYYYAGINPDDGEGTFGASGEFTMHADFEISKLTGSAKVYGDDEPEHTEFDADIKGNQFSGYTHRVDDTGLEGKIAGGFYGPNGEEIAGVAVGKAQPQQLWGDPSDPTTANPIDTSAVFLGKKRGTP